MLRLVLDTNTVLSGLLWGGTPARLVAAARAGEIALWSSGPLLDELRDVIHREKFALLLNTRDLLPDDLFDGYVALCQTADLAPIGRVSVDPDDDKVLASALAARAHLIVTGDRRHLLILRQFEGIPIVTAAQALAMVQGA